MHFLILLLFWETSSKAPFRTYCQYSYVLHLFSLFFIWETSSKAPFRTYCQYSYCLHLFFSLFFLLFSFAHTMTTLIQLKIPISLFKRFSSVSKRNPRYRSSFHFHRFSKHSILIRLLVNYEVSFKCSR